MHLNRRRSLAINAIHTRSRNHRRIPSLEGLEERVVLSPTIYTVTSIADGTSRGTLRLGDQEPTPTKTAPAVSSSLVPESSIDRG